jgi:hypothetical protein
MKKTGGQSTVMTFTEISMTVPIPTPGGVGKEDGHVMFTERISIPETPTPSFPAQN